MTRHSIITKSKAWARLGLRRALYEMRWDTLLAPYFRGMGSILMFHRVLPEAQQSRLPVNREIEVSPDYLEAAVRHLRSRGYAFVSLDELAEALDKSVTRKVAAITFDDGYRDNLQYALPLLKSLNVPFALYVTTSFPDHTALIWWYALEEWLLQNRQGRTLAELDLEFSRLRTEVGSPQAVRAFFAARHIDPLRFATTLALNWDELRILAKEPLVTIGAHTVNHFPLSLLPEADARTEITESKRRLEQELGVKISHFSYPFGNRQSAGAREFRLAKEAGFRTATTTRSGNIFPEHRESLMALPRLLADGETLRRLNARQNGLMTSLKYGLRRVVTE